MSAFDHFNRVWRMVFGRGDEGCTSVQAMYSSRHTDRYHRNSSIFVFYLNILRRYATADNYVKVHYLIIITHCYTQLTVHSSGS